MLPPFPRVGERRLIALLAIPEAENSAGGATTGAGTSLLPSRACMLRGGGGMHTASSATKQSSRASVSPTAKHITQSEPRLLSAIVSASSDATEASINSRASKSGCAHSVSTARRSSHAASATVASDCSAISSACRCANAWQASRTPAAVRASTSARVPKLLPSLSERENTAPHTAPGHGGAFVELVRANAASQERICARASMLSTAAAAAAPAAKSSGVALKELSPEVAASARSDISLGSGVPFASDAPVESDTLAVFSESEVGAPAWFDTPSDTPVESDALVWSDASSGVTFVVGTFTGTFIGTTGSAERACS
mmetsp:Transcript_36860/g.91767  ORF Transcript_36860/g.91767 Transcript_36860/m.91767 type:complete len:315 (-) Transcript_36860:1400-2344(-)